jgi:hypothetical protein
MRQLKAIKLMSLELCLALTLELINPTTDEGNGAFPFRTGISAVRISVVDILNNIEEGYQLRLKKINKLSKFSWR